MDCKKNAIPLEKEGRTLVWHEEFEAESIDIMKWTMERLMGGETRIYENNENTIRIDDGMLHMQVHRKGDIYSLCESLSTKFTMLFRYGYVEMRAKIPYRHGAWPSFWMKGDTPYLRRPEGRNNWFPETDIFEVFSANSYLVSNMHKWGHVNGKARHEQESSYSDAKHSYDFKNIETLNDEFHIYGMLWDEKSIKFSVDGEYFLECPIDENSNWKSEEFPDMMGFHDPQYLILSNEIFTADSWIPNAGLTPDDEMPIDYYVDYIRLYQKGEKEKIYQGGELAKKLAMSEYIRM